MTSTKIDEDAKRLVIARLGVMPDNMGIAVGSDGNYTREQLLEHVENEDEVGTKFIDLDLEFLRAMKEGSLFEGQNISTHQA